jgi:hypothetical protein
VVVIPLLVKVLPEPTLPPPETVIVTLVLAGKLLFRHVFLDASNAPVPPATLLVSFIINSRMVLALFKSAEGVAASASALFGLPNDSNFLAHFFGLITYKYSKALKVLLRPVCDTCPQFGKLPINVGRTFPRPTKAAQRCSCIGQMSVQGS